MSVLTVVCNLPVLQMRQLSKYGQRKIGSVDHVFRAGKLREGLRYAHKSAELLALYVLYNLPSVNPSRLFACRDKGNKEVPVVLFCTSPFIIPFSIRSAL